MVSNPFLLLFGDCRLGSDRIEARAMDLAVGGGVLKLIFTLVVAIRASASTAKQNKEDCLQIARRAGKLHATLAAGAHTLAEATRQHPAVASVLDDLREALREALEGVKACQRDCGALIRLLKAARVSAQLRVLNRDIKDRIMDVLLVTSIYTNGLVYTMHLYHMEHLRIQVYIILSCLLVLARGDHICPTQFDDFNYFLLAPYNDARPPHGASETTSPAAPNADPGGI